MQPHSLKLSPESDLINSIKEYSLSNNLYGYVSGVVGNLRKVCIQCPGNQEINRFEGNLEIVSLNGHFNKGDVHLHLSFADEGCNVFGGHLEEGCIVKKGTDILLLSFEQKIINISSNDLLKKTLFNEEFYYWILFAAISPGIIAFSLYTLTIKYLGPSTTGFTLYLYTIYGAFYGIIFFSEILENYHLIGTIFVFFGIYLVRRKSKNEIKA